MIRRGMAVSALAIFATLSPSMAEEGSVVSSIGEKPIWVRYPAIAPDGETLSFTYRGRIFVVDAEGGLAVPLTANGTYSYGAIWSPDAEKLAFASDLSGDDDVYVTDFSGSLERMTWSAASEVPTSFSPDGETVLYTAARLGDAEQSVQAALSGKPQLYAVTTSTGREHLVLPNLAEQAQWNREGSKLVYSYNPSGDPSERQHRVAPNARQLWTYDKVSGMHEQLFAVDGVDRHNPVWSADGQTLYYLSEGSGWLNVWKLDMATREEVQITRFEGDPVRDLSVADDGTIAFSNRGRIYVQKPAEGDAKPIEVLTLEQRAARRDNLRAETVGEFASSPDGELFAMIANADVFVQDLVGNFRQITATPGQERDIVFSPDGSMLAYAALRDHKWGIYAVDLYGDDDHGGLAPDYTEIPLYVPEEGNAYVPRFSPDGTKLAFVADRREIQVLDLASGDVTKLYGEGDHFSQYRDGVMHFAWSPNSKDLFVPWRAMDGSESQRIAVVPADGSGRAQPIGLVPSFFEALWSLDGSQIVGSTLLYGPRDAQLHPKGTDLYRIFLSEEARQDFLDNVEGTATGPAEDGEEDVAPRYSLDTFRHSRLEDRLTDGEATMLAFWPLQDMQNLLAVSPTGDDSYLLQTVSLADGSVTPFGSFDAPGLQALSFVPEKGVLDAKVNGTILRVPLSTPDQIRPIKSRLYYSRDADAARIAAFEQAWADAEYRYYDAGHEGRDWHAIGDKYRAYLSSIASDRELRELITAMYGELSASHMFTGYRGMESFRLDLGNNNDALGVFLDHGYEGSGRRVAAILPGGPLDRRSIDIEPGDIIVSVNGRDVPDAGGLDRLLDLNVGRPALLGVKDAETADERFYTVTPINRDAELQLAKTRLIDARREMVARLSNSCVAYQYVPAMDEDAYLDLLGNISANRGIAKAALIDVRSNGGGNLTRELITLLTGEVYSSVGRDDGPQDVEPNNRWVWPSAVLVDSFGYSDGSVFPQAYQDNAIGSLVGDIVLNTGTAVDYVRSTVVPGLVYGLPVLPNRRVDGGYYENNIIEPEIHVPFNPNNVGLNTDPQLEAGVAALMEQIGADADCRIQ